MTGGAWLSAGTLVPLIGSLLGGLLGIAGILVAGSGERSLRRRIARDVETWEKLPLGSQPRTELFRLIGRQVDALVRPDGREAVLLDRIRWLSLITLGLASMSLTFIVERRETPDSWLVKIGAIGLVAAMIVAGATLWNAGQLALTRFRRRRTGA